MQLSGRNKHATFAKNGRNVSKPVWHQTSEAALLSLVPLVVLAPHVRHLRQVLQAADQRRHHGHWTQQRGKVFSVLHNLPLDRFQAAGILFQGNGLLEEFILGGRTILRRIRLFRF